MDKLNNKGYMLIEIILASAIAFGVAFFLLELVINLKNKNDDMLVRTLVTTDQAIITNMIMDDLYKNDSNNFKCSDIKINNNVFEYKGKTNIVNEYTKIGNVHCNSDGDIISITVPLKVEIIDDDFDVDIRYRK